MPHVPEYGPQEGSGGAYAFGGSRVIRGGSGEDRISSSGDVADTIYARDGDRDTVSCGPKEDTVYFDKGIDTVNPINCEKRIAQ